MVARGEEHKTDEGRGFGLGGRQSAKASGLDHLRLKARQGWRGLHACVFIGVRGVSSNAGS
jgi:hypothetical protein